MTVYIFLYFCHNTYHRYICPVLHNNRLPDSYLETSFVVGRIGGTYVRADFSRIYRTMFRFYYCRRTNRSYDRPFYYSQICRNYPYSRSLNFSIIFWFTDFIPQSFYIYYDLLCFFWRFHSVGFSDQFLHRQIIQSLYCYCSLRSQ